MIKAILHKILSSALACLVLFSTMSFTVEKHYCGENLIDVAIFSNASNCGMDMEAITDNYKEKISCCKDEVEVLKGQDQLKKASFEDLQFEQQLFLSTFVYSYLNLFEGLAEQIIPFKHYTPPKLIANIHLRDQVFII